VILSARYILWSSGRVKSQTTSPSSLATSNTWEVVPGRTVDAGGNQHVAVFEAVCIAEVPQIKIIYPNASSALLQAVAPTKPDVRTQQ
jgi:hypothetical protein